MSEWRYENDREVFDLTETPEMKSENEQIVADANASGYWNLAK
jgi:hypothetical protein